MDSFNSPTTKPLFKGIQITWYALGLIEGLLLFRFILKLFGANSAAGFSQFIYGITNIFASPFLNVFGKTYVAGNSFEWTTLLAMLVYWIIAFGIIQIFLMSKTVSTSEAAQELNNQSQNNNQ